MKYFALIIFPVVLCFFSSCKSKVKELPVKDKTSVSVDVIVAGAEDIVSAVEVNGSVLSDEMVEFRPEVSGRLVFLNLPDGATVTKGTILARINDADLQAQLEQQKNQLDLANKTLKRLSELLKVNGVNQADYDLAQNQVNNYTASINILNAQIDKTIIRAPFTGELGIRLVSPGAYVTPSILLGTLQKKDKVKIDFSVPETLATILKKGDKIRVQPNNLGESMEAIISAIEPQINTATRNIKVRALLSNGVLTPGSFVKVLLDQSRKSIMAPTNSIIPDALSNQIVVVKKNKAVFVNVETGLRNPGLVELVSGVSAGDTIIVSGMLFVRPNALVSIKKVKKLKELN
jgi:membrane fusion protein (multidrug efflux system)